jgi:PadR family transcriptional regulator, regulatory protein PadR
MSSASAGVNGLTGRGPPGTLPSIVDGYSYSARDPPVNLIQGTLDVLVLKAFLFGPLHGYAVAQWIRDTTEGTLAIEEGALYTSLHRLEKRKLLSSEWGLSENNRRAKYYALTKAGRSQLNEEIRTWSAYSAAVNKVLHSTGATP